MKPDTFVDTSGFYAALVRKDDRHRQAALFLHQAGEQAMRFVTTDYVLDETLTLLKARAVGHLVPGLLKILSETRVFRVEWTDPERFEKAQTLLLRDLEQPYSFTDCVSFCLMKELGLREALTKDRHFRAAGFIPLLA